MLVLQGKVYFVEPMTCFQSTIHGHNFSWSIPSNVVVWLVMHKVGHVFHLIIKSPVVVGFWWAFSLKILFNFKGRGREGEREKNINVWKINQLCLTPPQPPTGDWPATQARALTKNQTGNPSLRRMMLNQVVRARATLVRAWWVFLWKPNIS